MQNLDKITQNILAALDANTTPWRKPWRTLAGAGGSTPHNAITGRAYRGVNLWLLMSAPYTTQGWVTFNQARTAGGSVRKGEHGTQIVFWKPTKYATKNDAGEDVQKGSLLLRFYTVFNVEQCDGMTLPERPAVSERLESMDAIYARLQANVKHGGDNAFYLPVLDYVTMPYVGAFTSEDAYKATAFHELTHWTGHNSRLARPLMEARFGNQAYAFEELVAELGSAFLCSTLGINSSLECHASYIDGWRRVIKDDPRAVITAASKAQAAHDFIMNLATVPRIISDETEESEL